MLLVILSNGWNFSLFIDDFSVITFKPYLLSRYLVLSPASECAAHMCFLKCILQGNFLFTVTASRWDCVVSVKKKKKKKSHFSLYFLYSVFSFLHAAFYDSAWVVCVMSYATSTVFSFCLNSVRWHSFFLAGRQLCSLTALAPAGQNHQENTGYTARQTRNTV